MRLRACLLAIAVVVPVRAFAQTPPPPAPPPSVVITPAAPAPAAVVIVPPPAPLPVVTAPAIPLPKLTWGGLVDTYYLFNFDRADGASTLTPPVGRAFDTNANSMTLALAKLSLNASMDLVSFQLDLGYGTTGTVINGANNGVPATTSPGAPTNIGPSFLVEQAFGTISLPGNLTLDFGKFVTTAGAEVIDANKNWLYSRSFLFNSIPLVHTGVRANLKVNDKLSLQASLVNGWNNDPDDNAWKTIGLNATITVNSMVSIIPTVYFGKETAQAATGGTPGDVRVLADLVVPITVNDRLGLNLNVDFIDAPSTSPIGTVSMTPDNSSNYIIGVSAMGKFTINDHAYLAARGEFIRTHAGEGGLDVNNNLGEGTVMLGVPVGKNFELRPEVRADFSGDDVFASNTKKDQVTGEIAALTFF